MYIYSHTVFKDKFEAHNLYANLSTSTSSTVLEILKSSVVLDLSILHSYISTPPYVFDGYSLKRVLSL